jgi:hypothetical protein
MESTPEHFQELVILYILPGNEDLQPPQEEHNEGADSRCILYNNKLFNLELIWSWGTRAMAMAGEVTQHGRSHPYSWSVSTVSLRSK